MPDQGGGGIPLGNYRCACREGTFFPTRHVNRSDQSWSGLEMEEQEAYQLWQGQGYGDNRSFSGTMNNSQGWKCLPCPPCDSFLCLTKLPCSVAADMHYRLPLVIITSVSILAVFILFILTIKYRHEKIMKASSPPLLFVTLIGALLLYSEVLVAAFVSTDFTCMLRPWVRHLGFATAYGGILFKTWRISVIMRVYKSRMFRTKDSELFRKLGLSLFGWILFLLTWTLADPTRASVPVDRGRHICQLKPWTLVAAAGECVFLCWGGFLCYLARKAPDLYNETRPISYIVWNEAVWEIFYVISRILLHLHPDLTVSFAVHFLRAQFTATVLLILLFVPKFIAIFSKLREVRGTLTDVGGTRRVHRLSLVVNKAGDIKRIYCVPCGPLVYLDRNEGSESSSQDSIQENSAKEDEYSKAEVDALIELVSQLKTEKELYKTQVRKLLQMLRMNKRQNGFPAFSPTTPLPEEVLLSRKKLTLPIIKEPLVDNLDEETAAQQRYHVATQGGRASRASTCTTFVSTPDETSLTFSDCRASEGRTPCDDATKQFMTSPTGECGPCVMNGNGISKYAWNVIRRQLAQNHVIGKDTMQITSSPETEDFPRIVQPHERFCNRNVDVAPRPLIPTVYGWEGNEDCVMREMQDLSPGTPSSNTSPESPSNVSSKTAETPIDKPNFIMYI